MDSIIKRSLLSLHVMVWVGWTMALCLAGKLPGNTLICSCCCVVLRGDTEDEIMSKAGEHGEKGHNVKI